MSNMEGPGNVPNVLFHVYYYPLQIEPALYSLKMEIDSFIKDNIRIVKANPGSHTGARVYMSLVSPCTSELQPVSGATMLSYILLEATGSGIL